MAQKFTATLTMVSAIQAATMIGGKPSLFSSWTITVSIPKKYVPGISQAKGAAAGRKFRPNVMEMIGPAANAAITTTGNISTAVTNTALFANRALSAFSFAAESLGNRSDPSTTGNIIVFSART